MIDLLYDIKYFFDVVKDTNIKSLNSEQKEYVFKQLKHNINFKYGINENNNYIIIADKISLKLISDYLGEENDFYTWNELQYNNDVIIEYDEGFEKLEKIFNKLKEFE